MGCIESSKLSSSSSEPLCAQKFATQAACEEACEYGACCEGKYCNVVPKCDCEASGGTFLGSGATCASNPCDPPGACCVGKSCVLVTQDGCKLRGGIFLGAGTVCTPNPCEAHGACCTGSTCAVMSESECKASSGTFMGSGTVCNPSPCPGACCLPNNGGCATTTQAGCISLNGSYLGQGSSCAQTQPNTNNFTTAIVTVTGVAINEYWKSLISDANQARILSSNTTVSFPTTCAKDIPVCSGYSKEFSVAVGPLPVTVQWQVLDKSCEPRFVTLSEPDGTTKYFETGLVSCSGPNGSPVSPPFLSCGTVSSDITGAQVSVSYA